MINLDHYLAENHQMAKRLDREFEYYSTLVRNELRRGNFDKAEIYADHIKTMVIELRRLNRNKIYHEKVQEVLLEMSNRKAGDEFGSSSH